MRFLPFIIFVSFLSMSLLSCSPQNRKEAIPTDDATVEERATIEKTMSHLTELFKANGYTGNFDSMPILVTSEDPNETGRVGYCDELGLGTGRYIVINRWTFEQDMEDDSKSEVTATLLHEIGHCYFARGHDHDLISSADYVINLEYSGERGGTQIIVDGIPATVMYVTPQERPNSSVVTSNRELQTYYVRELLGLERIQNMNDLNRFKSVKVFKKSDIE